MKAKKGKTMSKKKKENEYKDVDRESNNVYMFHNVRHNLHLFINAENAEGAYEQFDKCNFVDRSEWNMSNLHL